MKYIKVMNGNKGANYEYKINEINIANHWNPKASSGRDFGGFNFSTEDKMIRWLVRGDTLYDIKIPKDAEVIDVVESATPHGVFRSNKIIPTNPRKVTDEMALDFYHKSNIPEIAYYKAMAGCAVMGYEKTVMQIFRDKVNNKNIDLVLDEWNDFVHKRDRSNANKLIPLISEYLNEIKSDKLISITISKDPYIKTITKDKIINITGESGSGKSTYTKKYQNKDYIIIDTDEIYQDKPNNIDCQNFRQYLINKYHNNLPNKTEDFAILYKEILDYFKNDPRTLVIDSAQYRNLINKDNLKLLKGQIIIIRTCIDECYNRCLKRWKTKFKDKSIDEYNQFADRKKEMYSWYKALNRFIKEVDKI